MIAKSSRILLVFLISLCQLLPASAVAAGNAPTILFFVDISGSMRGQKLESVKNAIREVVPIISAESQISLYVFGNSVKEIESATLDRTLILSKLDSLQAGGKTSLYDALYVALDLSESLQPARVILLSDGKDTASKFLYDQILEQMTQRKAGFDIVGLQLDSGTSSKLQMLTTASGGNFYQSTEIDELSNLYMNIIRDVSEIEDRPAETIRVTVPENRGLEYAISAAAGVTAFWFMLYLYSKFDQRKSILNNFKLIESYVRSNNRFDLRKTGKRLRSSGFIPKQLESMIKQRLEVIHSEKHYSQILIGLWVGIFAVTFFGLSLFGNLLFALIFSVICTYQAFSLGCKIVLKRQRDRFDEELPEMLNVVASGLSAGLGLQQSLEAFATDSEGEVGFQLRRALGEMRVGTPVDDALLGVANRMENASLKWVVTALSIQRIVGGSLATVIRNSYETMRSRSEIKREVKTLSAEGRLSANVLIALPIFIFLFLFFTRREYISGLWSSSLGFVLIIILCLNMLFGILWMRKIVDIKI